MDECVRIIDPLPLIATETQPDPGRSFEPGVASGTAPSTLRHSSTDIQSCRFCGHAMNHVFADLGLQPIANDNRQPGDINRMEPFFPLRAMVCEHCFLVQAQEMQSASELFNDGYTYFSSYSSFFLSQAKNYAQASIKRFGLNRHKHVIEVACNDGYLLRWFQDAGIPVLGIEPTASTANDAIARGIPVDMAFFGREKALELAAKGVQADLMPANNVVAHVPDINDFIEGFRILLKSTGVATFEFHHLLNLLTKNQFDTIYHEHYYYHSLSTFQLILAEHGLRIFDVEEIPSHGGSLRVYVQHAGSGIYPIESRVDLLLEKEARAGLRTLAPYLAFGKRINAMKRRLLTALIEAKEQGKSIAAYGAPAKGNTLLNFAGIRTDFIDYTVDRNPHKQDTYLPGTQIPVFAPEHVMKTRPDLLLILCWNLVDEIEQQMAGIRDWGGVFITLIPEVRIF